MNALLPLANVVAGDAATNQFKDRTALRGAPSAMTNPKTITP
jgi:hypothetical protein